MYAAFGNAAANALGLDSDIVPTYGRPSSAVTTAAGLMPRGARQLRDSRHPPMTVSQSPPIDD
jgi:hypothetical protein